MKRAIQFANWLLSEGYYPSHTHHSCWAKDGVSKTCEQLAKDFKAYLNRIVQ